MEINDSVKLRMESIVAAKLHAMHVFCQSEREKGYCRCGYTLKCCEYNPSKPTSLLPECERILSNILLFDIEDIINFAKTPRSGTPVDILKEAMKHPESAALGKGDKHLHIGNETHSEKV